MFISVFRIRLILIQIRISGSVYNGYPTLNLTKIRENTEKLHFFYEKFSAPINDLFAIYVLIFQMH